MLTTRSGGAAAECSSRLRTIGLLLLLLWVLPGRHSGCQLSLAAKARLGQLAPLHSWPSSPRAAAAGRAHCPLVGAGRAGRQPPPAARPWAASAAAAHRRTFAMAHTLPPDLLHAIFLAQQPGAAEDDLDDFWESGLVLSFDDRGRAEVGVRSIATACCPVVRGAMWVGLLCTLPWSNHSNALLPRRRAAGV